MLNVNKLRGAMAEANVTQKDIAALLKKSENTISNRFNGIGAFDIDEAERICELVGITDNDRKVEIFLSQSSH